MRGGACRRGFSPHLQRHHPLLPPSLHRLAGRGFRLPNRRRGIHVGGRSAGAPRPYRNRGDRRSSVATRKFGAVGARRYCDVDFLRVFFLEIRLAAAGSHRGRISHQFDMAAATGNPLFVDDRRDGAADPASVAAGHSAADRSGPTDMSTLAIGLLYGAGTLLVMFSGMPISFALGAVATVFMIAFMPSSSVDTISQNVYEEMSSITLLAIPLFILKGAAIGKSRAGRDLYGALHAWLHRIPGGLGIANVFACALFAAKSRPSARPAFPRCASAAIRDGSPPASSRRAARSASSCRPRSP